MELFVVERGVSIHSQVFDIGFSAQPRIVVPSECFEPFVQSSVLDFSWEARSKPAPEQRSFLSCFELVLTANQIGSKTARARAKINLRHVGH